MEDTKISFDTANLAREKKCELIKNETYYASFSRFNDATTFCTTYENALSYEITDGQDNEGSVYSCLITLKTYKSLPTQTVLQKWLREVHNIDIFVSPIHETEEIKSLIKYWYYILDVEDESDDEVFYGTWEEALELGLQEALKLVKNG